MKSHLSALLYLVAFAFGLVALQASLDACTPGQRQAARTVIDVLQATCLVAHADLPDETAMKVCDVVDALAPEAKEMLKASREQTRLARESAGCSRDAGGQ